MIRVLIAWSVADYLRATNELTAGARDAVMAAPSRSVTNAQGGVVMHREISCSREQAAEIMGWLNHAAGTYALGTANEEFGAELLIAAKRISEALASTPK